MSGTEKHGELDSDEQQFDRAFRAVISGNAETLRTLLEDNPRLIQMRSPGEHRAMLINYVPANGVEDEFQKTPANAVEIAKILIDAGADINAKFLDGGSGSTPLVSLVTSVHPHVVGVATDLVEVFVKAGANVDGLKGDGAPLRCALKFGYPESAAALERCGAQIKNVVFAAGLGRLDLVKEFLEKRETSEDDLVSAWGYACMYGWTEIAEYMLQQGIDVDAQWYWGFTGLMWAVRYGHIETIKLILNQNPSLEIKNKFGATSIGTAMHFHTKAPEPGADYAAVMDLLLAAGSEFAWSKKETGNMEMDTVLRKHGVIE
jgi:ankyrin repeat protein